MNYDDIFKEIGLFGNWQKLVFFMACLGSMCLAFLELGYSSFIGFTPKFRCFIPECDGVNRNDAYYNANYSVFTIPEWGCTEESCLQNSQCKMYVHTGDDNMCSADNFNNKTLKICDEHVYDKTQYENSFIAEFDLAPPCESENDGWPLEVVTETLFIH